MGISRERKKKHKNDMIGEKRGRLPDSLDYTKIGKDKKQSLEVLERWD